MMRTEPFRLRIVPGATATLAWPCGCRSVTNGRRVRTGLTEAGSDRFIIRHLLPYRRYVAAVAFETFFAIETPHSGQTPEVFPVRL